MRKGYVLVPEAEQDLVEIGAFVAQDSVGAAKRLITEFESAMDRLAKLPGVGHMRPDLTERPVRFWPVRSYLIVYRPDTKPIQVIRVLSGYRDVAALLRPSG